MYAVDRCIVCMGGDSTVEYLSPALFSIGFLSRNMSFLIEDFCICLS